MIATLIVGGFDTTADGGRAKFSKGRIHAEVLTDIKSPGHIVRRQGGRTLLDVEVKSWETNNPYLVFPVPPNVKTAAVANSR